MALPVRDVNRPALLSGQHNGRLDAAILRRVNGVNGSPDVVLVDPASRSFEAMRAAAKAEGHDLYTTSVTNSYRPYADQARIFLARYKPSKFGTIRWSGKRWRKLPGVAVAAVPGTSNHGWGLAVDLRLTAAATTWLKIHAHRFGWSWEIQSEPWHLRYWAGDDIPQPVLEHEGATTNIEDSMILLHDSDSGTWRVAVPGEGSAVISEPAHWAGVVSEGRKTGVYSSPYMSDLITKIRAER